MQFRRDEIEPLHEPITLQRNEGRGEFLFGHAIGKVLNNGWPLGEHLPVVEQQGGYVAIGVDGGIVGSRFRFFAGEVHPFLVEDESAFVEDDMGGEGNMHRGCNTISWQSTSWASGWQ